MHQHLDSVLSMLQTFKPLIHCFIFIRLFTEVIKHVRSRATTGVTPCWSSERMQACCTHSGFTLQTQQVFPGVFTLFNSNNLHCNTLLKAKYTNIYK